MRHVQPCNLFLFLDLLYLFCYKEKEWPGPSATIPKTGAIPRVGFVADHPDRSGNDRAQIAYMRGSHKDSRARAPSYVISDENKLTEKTTATRVANKSPL